MDDLPVFDAKRFVVRGWLHKRGDQGLVKSFKKRWFNLEHADAPPDASRSSDAGSRRTSAKRSSRPAASKTSSPPRVDGATVAAVVAAEDGGEAIVPKTRLRYYVQQGDGRPKGAVDMTVVTDVRVVDRARLEFDVETPTRVYQLRAGDEEALDAWVRCLSAVLKVVRPDLDLARVQQLRESRRNASPAAKGSASSGSSGGNAPKTAGGGMMPRLNLAAVVGGDSGPASAPVINKGKSETMTSGAPLGPERTIRVRFRVRHADLLERLQREGQLSPPSSRRQGGGGGGGASSSSSSADLELLVLGSVPELGCWDAAVGLPLLRQVRSPRRASQRVTSLRVDSTNGTVVDSASPDTAFWTGHVTMTQRAAGDQGTRQSMGLAAHPLLEYQYAVRNRKTGEVELDPQGRRIIRIADVPKSLGATASAAELVNASDAWGESSRRETMFSPRGSRSPRRSPRASPRESTLLSPRTPDTGGSASARRTRGSRVVTGSQSPYTTPDGGAGAGASSALGELESMMRRARAVSKAASADGAKLSTEQRRRNRELAVQLRAEMRLGSEPTLAGRTDGSVVVVKKSGGDVGGSNGSIGRGSSGGGGGSAGGSSSVDVLRGSADSDSVGSSLGSLSPRSVGQLEASLDAIASSENEAKGSRRDRLRNATVHVSKPSNRFQSAMSLFPELEDDSEDAVAASIDSMHQEVRRRYRRELVAQAKERAVPDVTPVLADTLTVEELFGPEDGPVPAGETVGDGGIYVNIERLREHLLLEGRLTRDCAMQLVMRARNQLCTEPNMLELEAPFSVFGDVHGQYYDMVRLMEMAGEPTDTPYLWLGDYVDRGWFGCEVVFLLYACKLRYPKTFFMIRGNHECRLLARNFNFEIECRRKYGLDVFDAVMDSFDALPLAALMTNNQGRVLCVHGGLSPDVWTIDEINNIDRFCEPEKRGPLTDLLWSDPIEDETGEGLDDDDMEEWWGVSYVENPNRGCGYVFGYQAIKQFLDDNDLMFVVRAHEVQKEGFYEHRFYRDDCEHPLALTVFSAPNYCDFYNNEAAFLLFDRDEYSIKQISWTDHPYVLPNMLDAFTYSLPFVMENLTEITGVILREALQAEDPSGGGGGGGGRGRAMKTISDVLAKAKLLKRLSDMRLKETTEEQSKMERPHTFHWAKRKDAENERRPRRSEIFRSRNKTL